MQAKKKVYLLLGIIIVLMPVLEVLFAHPHHHRLWNVVPGADLVIGFGGAWLLILLGKVILNKLLRRPEDYYAESSKPKEAPEAVASIHGVADNRETEQADVAAVAQSCERILEQKQKEGDGHV